MAARVGRRADAGGLPGHAGSGEGVREPRRDGERNEALDTTVYAMAALHGLISMGLRLNKEAEAIDGLPWKGAGSGAADTAEPPKIIRSRWMVWRWQTLPGLILSPGI